MGIFLVQHTLNRLNQTSIPGRGAEFVFIKRELTPGAETGARIPSVIRDGMNPGSDNILYIDDDPDDLFIFSETLETQYPQYKILQAQNGEEGLNKMREMAVTPCLVILDMNMPKVDGRQILQSIRQNPHWAKVPVVVFTTSASTADITFGKNYGASFVTKPMTYDSLKETVKTLVGYCDAGEKS